MSINQKRGVWGRSSLRSGETQGDRARPSPQDYAAYSVYLLCQILASLISTKSCCRREEKDTGTPQTGQMTRPETTPMQ